MENPTPFTMGRLGIQGAERVERGARHNDARFSRAKIGYAGFCLQPGNDPPVGTRSMTGLGPRDGTNRRAMG